MGCIIILIISYGQGLEIVILLGVDMGTIIFLVGICVFINILFLGIISYCFVLLKRRDEESYMIIKEIDITSNMGLKLLMEEDLFVVKIYENNLAGYKENVVYKCKVRDSSVEEMIDHLDNTYKVIMKKQ